MDKKLLAIIAIIIAIFIYIKNLPPQDNRIAYAEGRVKVTVANRDIEIVVLTERTKPECESGFLAQITQKACTNNPNCTASKFECKSEISERYQKMLNKEPISTHYAHVTRNNDNARGALLFWGLTDKESDTICHQILDMFQLKKLDTRQECI